LVNVAIGTYHSAIYFGVTFQDWETYAGRPANVNPSIHHNVICQPSTVNRPMVEIRFANELGGLSALSGNPTMNNNCYYIAGKNASFSDSRPGNTLSNARLVAWQTHISSDSGSLEVNPSLDVNYVATNPLCAGMGIQYALIVTDVPGTGETEPEKPPAGTLSVTYSTHIENIGWQIPVATGQVSGTTGKALRLEGLKVNLINTTGYAGGIRYATHIENIGWQASVNVTTTGSSTTVVNGGLSGTEGRALRMEAMTIELTGELAAHYDIYYRVHTENIGWMGWAKNGETAGSAGHALRLEALQVVILPKGSAVPANNYMGVTTPAGTPRMIDPSIISSGLGFSAVIHIQDIGDRSYTAATGTTILGTTGQRLRLEAMTLSLRNQPVTGGITYETHIENIGWQPARSNGQMAGTAGRALRLEAIRISLTGEMANRYDVYYRTHIENIGWTGWARNGQSCGSAGYSYRMEAMQIVIVPKGGTAPGMNTGYFYQR